MSKNIQDLTAKTTVVGGDRVLITDSEDLSGGEPTLKLVSSLLLKGQTGDAGAPGSKGDPGDLTINESTPVAEIVEVKSALSTALTGDDNDLVFTSKLVGVLGDDSTIAYVAPATPNAELGIVVTGSAIVVNLATANPGYCTTTASDIITAIEADAAANALVGVVNKASNDGSGIVTAMAAASLAGGVDPVAATVGEKGTIVFDATNLYVAYEDNTWKKITLLSM